MRSPAERKIIMLKKIISGVIAGILIALGGGVFLACENRYVGAVLFSVALLCICIKQYALYTGKICYIPEKHGKEQFSVLLLGLLGIWLFFLVITAAASTASGQQCMQWIRDSAFLDFLYANNPLLRWQIR